MKLVILPGMDGQGIQHDPFIDCLSPELEAVSLQLPKYLAAYSDLSLALADQLPNEEFVIMAESFSGPLAVKLAFEHPVKALIFTASFVGSPRPMLSAFARLTSFLPIRHLAGTAITEWTMIGRRFSATEQQDFRETISQLPEATLKARCIAALSASPPSHLPCPALAITARRDRLVSRTASNQLTALCTQTVIVDAPHFIIQSIPCETAKIINQFTETL